jgi:predicted DNA-binding protein (UPF0251 family)
MVRPKKDRIVGFNPDVSYFKPRGIPLVDLDEVCLTVDEREAIRLADLLGLSHEDAGLKMGVSRATFGRIVQQARNTVADALINGKAINVEGGNYRLVSEIRSFMCRKCHHQWNEPRGTGRPFGCPACKHDDFYRFLGDDEPALPGGDNL